MPSGSRSWNGWSMMQPPVSEIPGAAGHELIERDIERLAAAARLQHTCGARCGEFHFPHALAAVAAVLLDDARPGRLQATRELVAERIDSAIEVGIGAPAEMPRGVKDLLHPHLERHIGMRTDPHAAGRNIAQHRIEPEAVLAVGDRIDPDEHAIHLQQLLADLVDHIVIVDRRLRVDAKCRQGGKDRVPPVVVRLRVSTGLTVAAP